MSANVTNKTFLAGLMNLAEIFNSGSKNVGAVAAGLLNNQIPLSSLRNSLGEMFVQDMKELSTSFRDKLTARNQFLPNNASVVSKVDIINGQPLNKYTDPLTWSMNTLTRFNIGSAPTPGKMLMIKGKFALADQFNNGPNKEPLENDNDLRAAYHKKIATAVPNIEQLVVAEVNKNPAILTSIADMEANPNKFAKPMDWLHNQRFAEIVQRVKNQAWVNLANENQQARLIQEQTRLKKDLATTNSQNNPKDSAQLQTKIDQLDKLIKY